jgi:hypothetical protein
MVVVSRGKFVDRARVEAAAQEARLVLAQFFELRV